MSDDVIPFPSFNSLPRAYREWIMLDRNGRDVTIDNVGGYTVTMTGRFKGRATRLHVPFSPEDMAKASQAVGPIHVFDRIAEAMVRRYNMNAAALNRLSPKELREIEKARFSKVLDFSNPIRDP